MVAIIMNACGHADPSTEYMINELEHSRAALKRATENQLAALDDGKTDHQLVDSANRWYPVAMQANKLCMDVINEKNKAALHSRIEALPGAISALNQQLWQEQQHDIRLWVKDQLTLLQVGSEDTLPGFSRSVLQLGAQRMALGLAKVCSGHLPHSWGYDGWDQFIMTQNAQVLKPGNELVITGGLGFYYYYRSVDFIVNGVKRPHNNDGLYEARIKTPLKKGRYAVPIHVKYLDQDEKEQIIDRKLEYEIQ